MSAFMTANPAAHDTGISAERRRMTSGNETAGDFFPRQHRTQRQTASQRFGQGHDVGLHAELFVAEKLPRPPHASLHLIENQQQPALIADFAQTEHINLVRDYDSALGLNRLNENGDCLLAVDRGLHGIQIVIRHLTKSHGQRIITRADLFLAGGRQRCERTSVKRIVGRENLELATAFFESVAARELDGRFVGFGSTVTKKSPIRERMAAELPSQLRLRLDVIEIGNMQQLLGLPLDRFDDRRVAVAKTIDRDAGKKIEIFLAIGIPNLSSPSFDQRDGRPRISPGNVFFG